jgi:hypothetical protein
MNNKTNDFNTSNLIDLSEEDLKLALSLLAKKRVRDEKVKNGEIKSYSWKDLSLEQKKKHMEYNKRRQVKINLLAQKAISSGIKVGDEEVEEYLKSIKK